MSHRKLSLVSVALLASLSACSALGGPDQAGLNQQIETCGASPAHFMRPSEDVIAPTPPGDAIAGDVDPASQKCVLDWARAHGFTVLTAEEMQQKMQEAGAL